MFLIAIASLYYDFVTYIAVEDYKDVNISEYKVNFWTFFTLLLSI